MDANKQGGRVRSLFGLLLPSANRRIPPRQSIGSAGMPRAARTKVMVVILLIGIASPFLG